MLSTILIALVVCLLSFTAGVFFNKSRMEKPEAVEVMRPAQPALVPPAPMAAAPQRPTPDVVETSAPVEPVDTKVARTDDGEEYLEQLEQENAALRQQVAGLADWIHDNLPGHISPPTEILEHRKVALFNEDFELQERLAEELGLTESEYASVNRALGETLDAVDQLRMQNLEIRQQSDAQLFVKIPAFREEGEALEASLESSLLAELGEDRLAALKLMAGDALNDEFFHFGKAHQTITFKTYYSEEGGEPRIRIVDRIHLPQSSDTKTILQTKGNYTVVPDAYTDLVDWAPLQQP